MSWNHCFSMVSPPLPKHIGGHRKLTVGWHSLRFHATVKLSTFKIPHRRSTANCWTSYHFMAQISANVNRAAVCGRYLTYEFEEGSKSDDITRPPIHPPLSTFQTQGCQCGSQRSNCPERPTSALTLAHHVHASLQRFLERVSTFSWL